MDPFGVSLWGPQTTLVTISENWSRGVYYHQVRWRLLKHRELSNNSRRTRLQWRRRHHEFGTKRRRGRCSRCNRGRQNSCYGMVSSAAPR
ncbi:unnamed protein product [Ascophyllum nodosum]